MGRGGRRSIKRVTLGGSNNTESAPNPHALPPPRYLWLAPAAQLAATFDWPSLNNAGEAGRELVTPPAKAVAHPCSSTNCFAAHASLPPRRSKPLAHLRAERNVMLRHAQARARRRHAQGRPAAASRLRGSSCGTSSAFGAKHFSEWSWCFHPASFHFFLRHIMWPGVEEARNGRRHRRPRPSKGRRSVKTSERNRAAFGARGKSYISGRRHRSRRRSQWERHTHTHTHRQALAHPWISGASALLPPPSKKRPRA